MAVMASKEDKQAHQVLSSLPFRGSQLHDEEFLVHAQQKFGVPQTCLHNLINMRIMGGRGTGVVDKYGFEVANAAAPGGHWTLRHRNLERTIARDVRDAGIPNDTEVLNLFANCVTDKTLMRADTGGHNGLKAQRLVQKLIPDFLTEMPSETIRHQRVQVLQDIKTVSVGSSMYKTQSVNARTSVVSKKQRSVATSYTTKAKQADIRYNYEGQQQQEGVMGPVELKVKGYGRTRGLVFGAYGEVSSDVEELMSYVAENVADKIWMINGHDSPMAAKSRAMQVIRARWAAEAARGQAQTLLGRRQYCGLHNMARRANALIGVSLEEQLDRDIRY